MHHLGISVPSGGAAAAALFLYEKAPLSTLLLLLINHGEASFLTAEPHLVRCNLNLITTS